MNRVMRISRTYATTARQDPLGVKGSEFDIVRLCQGWREPLVHLDPVAKMNETNEAVIFPRLVRRASKQLPRPSREFDHIGWYVHCQEPISAAFIASGALVIGKA